MLFNILQQPYQAIFWFLICYFICVFIYFIVSCYKMYLVKILKISRHSRNFNFYQWEMNAKILNKIKRIKKYLCIPSTFLQSKLSSFEVGELKKLLNQSLANFFHRKLIGNNLLDVPWKILYFSDSSLKKLE